MLKPLLVLTLAILVLVGGTVSAHRPIFVETENTGPDQPVAIPNPEISWAVYARLTAGKAEYYEFSVPEEGMQLFAQLLVPTPAPGNFRPSLVLIGPGLAPEEPGIPVEVPPGMGAMVLPWQEKELFFEPFTQTRYHMAEELRTDLGQGKYFLAIFEPQGQGGKYTLAVGEEERWSWRDIFAFPGIWLRTRWWYSPGQTMAIILAAAAVLALAIYLFIRKYA